MSNIKLAIRVRPFSERELKFEKDFTHVINVIDDNTVTITNVKVSTSGAGDSRERVRRYHADYTFDSACHESDPKYASQDKVYESIGRDVVECMSRGVSACVLAYGQSSTGKTHTMMGTESQPGLIPRLCNALAMKPYQITVSFLEIYNERVHDLLVGEEQLRDYHSLPRRRGNSRKDLRVREHPARGPYVQNLRRVVVHDVQTLQALISEGARRRHTAPTRRNASSSRSHALLELSTPRATLHLADLAGSEKASWEGCGGGRQKEGANINKSLVALSNVISALVSNGCGRGRFVPYRDSALTWLLKDCFTGGAAAFIIATVSPSVACYGESASTLRWASRARQLRVSPRMPATSLQATRAALQTQLQQIICELAKHHIRYLSETGKLVYDENHWTLLRSNKTNDTVKDDDLTDFAMDSAKVKISDTQNSGSTASSVASGSSDTISGVEKETKVISKEVDKLFGPALERARSGSDLKVVAPLRNKRRQYKSQEVLPMDNKIGQSSQYQQISERNISLQDIVQNSDSFKLDNSLNELETKSHHKRPPPNIPIMYDNQRAEIVASVTERLYSKLKKREESAIAKVESVVDKKIMEPLSELKICTNARQKLVELSQKALRNKRKIGIPAHTQTKFRVTRVKDQGIDVQTDLEPYIVKEKNIFTFYQNVGTETTPITLRCKDISVGPKCGSHRQEDRSTLTETKRVAQRSCSVMTENCILRDRFTQTYVVPPPRKKRSSSYSKYLNNDNVSEEHTMPMISINITQAYATDNDSTSASDDSLENTASKPVKITTTPDLLTNHSSVDSKENLKEGCKEISNNGNMCQQKVVQSNSKEIQTTPLESSDNTMSDYDKKSDRETEDIFSDNEDYNLPRVSVDKSISFKKKDMKEMILGRNNDLYPYNIVLSPPRKVENVKRTVKFNIEPVSTIAQIVCDECHNELSNTESNNQMSEIDSESSNYTKISSMSSNSTNLSKATNNFVWKTGASTPNQYKIPASSNTFLKNDVYKPIYKRNTTHYQYAKARIYKEFLGLEPNIISNKSYTSSSDERNDNIKSTSQKSSDDESDHKMIKNFRQKREFFEGKAHSIFNQNKDPFYDFENVLLRSCDRLDASINKYDKYLKHYQQRSQQNYSPKRNYNSVTKDGYVHRKPKDYLNHLVQLRKDVVKGDITSGELSSGSIF